MRCIFLAAMLLGIVCPVAAQISGTVTRKDKHVPLQRANLALTGENNSIALQTTTDENGNFLFLMPPAGKYTISVSFLGFLTAGTTVTIFSGKKSLVLDTMMLTPAPLDLSTVNVKADKALFLIKGDTVEISAADLKTHEKASVLNLFQHIPGFTVDMDGNFFFKGVAIHELTIDGRPAFQNAGEGGADPKFLSRILSASLIDKIQIVDKKEIGSIGSAPKQQSINITIKKENKTRINGELGFGYGTDDSYKGAANASRFRDHDQQMVIASSGNTGSVTPPSSSDESMDMNMRFPGTMRDSRIALNTGFDVGKKAKFNFSYTHMDRDGRVLETQQKENFLPDSIFYYNSRSVKSNRLQADVINTNFNYDWREKNTFIFRGDLFFNRSGTANSSQYETLASGGKDTINFGNLSNLTNQKDTRAYLFAEYSHKFTSKAVLRISLNVDPSATRSDQLNTSMNQISLPGRSDTTDQLIRPTERNTNLTFNAMYFTPIGKQFYFQMVYNFTSGRIHNNQLAHDFNYGQKIYNLLDSTLSYQFENTTLAHLVSSSFNYHIGKFNASMGAAFGFNDTKSRGSTAVLNASQSYNYMSPILNLAYNFTPSSTLRADLSSSPLFPVTDRLIPVISVQNPMLVQLGNPDLKPGYSRRISLDYNYMNSAGTSFSIGGFATFEYNSLSTSVFTDSLARQVTMPINVNGTRALNPTLHFGKRFKGPGINLSYRVFGDFRRQVSMVNGQQNISHSTFFSQDFSLSWNYKSLLEVSTSALLNYRGNRYSVQNNAYYHFTDQKIFLKAVVFLPAGIQIGSAGIYFKNAGVPEPYILLNGWISKLLTKNKSWLVKIYGFDLLKQNKAQVTLLAPTYVDRTVSNSQTRYFMCSLTRYFK